MLSPPASRNLLSVSMNFTIPGTSYKWNPTVCVIVWLAYLTEQNVFKVHSYCSLCQDFFPFSDGILFHCMYRPHFVYPFICRWTLILFPRILEKWLLWIMLLWTLVYKYLFEFLPSILWDNLIKKSMPGPFWEWLQPALLASLSFLPHMPCACRGSSFHPETLRTSPCATSSGTEPFQGPHPLPWVMLFSDTSHRFVLQWQQHVVHVLSSSTYPWSSA